MEKKSKRPIGIVLLLMLLIACAVLYIYIYVIPDISGALTDTVVVPYVSKKITTDAKCIIVRDETVVNSEADGKASYYAEENVKTRKNTKVADVYPSYGDVKHYSLSSTGVVSYLTDSYESYFTVESLANIDPYSFEELEIVPEDCRKSSVSSGDPLYKVINSDTWYMALIMDRAIADLYSEDQNISVDFGDEIIKCTVTDIVGYGEKSLLIAKTKRYFKDYLNIRTADVSVISKTYEGLEVPKSAVFTNEDGKEGVMVLQVDGSYDFYRIKTVLEEEETVLVQQTSFDEKQPDGSTKTISTLKIYDEILRDAEDR